MTPVRGGLRPHRRTVAIASVAAGLALAVVAAAAFLVLGGGNGVRDGAGPLAWTAKPRVMRAPGSPREWILTGTVHNRSSSQVNVEASSVKALTSDGRAMPTSATFVSSFVRGVYSGSRLGREPDSERQRTGRLARITPGGSRPLTVAWRTETDQGPAARVEYPGGSLPIPR